MPLFLIPDNGGGNLTQILLFPQNLAAINRRPGQKRRIYINMKNNALSHGQTLNTAPG